MNERYNIIDNIRGLNLISMILYHAMWDFVYMYGNNIEWYKGTKGYIWQQCICSLFIFISGFCWSFGKNKLKRGMEVFLAGLIITAVTLLIMPHNRIIFGVLTFMGTCMLVMIPLDKMLKKANIGIGILICVMLFIILKNVNLGLLGFEKWNFFKLPQFLYANYFTTFLGFTHEGFYSTDYFSIFPWIFLFILGYFVYRFMQKNDYIKLLKGKRLPVITNIGKNTLIIYLLHQPVLYLLFIVFYK